MREVLRLFVLQKPNQRRLSALLVLLAIPERAVQPVRFFNLVHRRLGNLDHFGSSHLELEHAAIAVPNLLAHLDGLASKVEVVQDAPHSGHVGVHQELEELSRLLHLADRAALENQFFEIVPFRLVGL